MTDLTRFNLDMGGSMEPDDEGRWVRYEDVAAHVAPAEPMTWEQAVRKHINDTEYAERLLALPDDATAEQVHACAPRHHAPVAPALKYVDDPKQTGVGSWCAPGPAAEQKRMFVLRFEDQDRGEAHYTDEAEARAMFARAEARGWNCHLFVHVNRVAPVAPAEPAEGWVLVPKRMTQEMRDVTDSEGWTWEDLLAEAGSISQEEYAAIAAAPVVPEIGRAHV